MDRPPTLRIPANLLTLVRRHPERYLGQVEPNRLVMEVAKAFILNNSRRVTIAVSRKSRAHVSGDFQRGMPQNQKGRPSLAPLAEHLFWFPRPDVDSHQVSPFWGIAVANALSKHLRITLHALPAGLTQDYARGERIGKTRRVEPESLQWHLSVEFEIDDQIFGHAALSKAKLRRFCEAARLVFPATAILLKPVQSRSGMSLPMNTAQPERRPKGP